MPMWKTGACSCIIIFCGVWLIRLHFTNFAFHFEIEQFIQMTQYETVVIFTPILSDEEFKRTADAYKDIIKANGGEIVHEEQWGLRQLAYAINKKTTGIYLVLEYKGDNNAVAKLELQFKRDENILRFMTIKLDKFSTDYNERKRRGEIGKKAEKKTKAVTESNE